MMPRNSDHPLQVFLTALIVFITIGQLCSAEPSKVLFLPEQLVKYTLGDNTLHVFIDRPLLADRTMRGRSNDFRSFTEITPESFRRKCEIARMGGADGFIAFLGTAAHIYRYADVLSTSDFPIVPSFAPPSSGFFTEPLEKRLGPMEQSLDLIAKLPNPIRYNGKYLATSYNSSVLPPEKWKSVIQSLRDKKGDIFLQMADLNVFGGKPGYAWVKSFYTNGNRLDPDDEEKIRQSFRQYLDVADGIMFMCANDFRRTDLSLAAEFYRDVIVRLANEVRGEAAYKGKLLGLGVTTGYVNWFTGSTLYENGTRTFRESFEAAVSAPADFIVGFEWDEAAEGDYIQPSIYNSFTLQRLSRFYLDTVNHRALSPMPGDAVSIPNCAISYRKQIMLGERIDIEILNIPDGTASQPYDVSLTLADSGGKILAAYSVSNIDPARLSAQDIAVASEDIQSSVIVPSLSLKRAGGQAIRFEQGLPSISVSATRNDNRKCMKSPLRDILTPEMFSLRISPTDRTGMFDVSGDISCREDIASAELLLNDAEIWAFDPSQEYGDAVTYATYYAEFSSARVKELAAKLHFSCAFRVFGADKWLGRMSTISNTLILTHPWILIERGLYFQVPRSAAPTAAIDIDCNGYRSQVRLQDIETYKAVAKEYPQLLRYSIEAFDKLPDIAPHVNKKSIRFQTRIAAGEKNSALVLRVISRTGKIFWSKPSILERSFAANEPLDIYSVSKDAIITAQVSRDSIPSLDYAFTAGCGAYLPTPAGRTWFGELGGGYGYGEFNRYGNYPALASNSAPQWVTEDGRTCLKFDGIGNYIFFPRETIPQGSFTLMFEIKPTSSKDQYLSKGNAAKSPEPLDLIIENGRLKAGYLGRIRDGDAELWYKTLVMDTELEIPPDRWSRVEVAYDLKSFRFRVNRRESRQFPSDRLGYTFKPFVFGGNNPDAKYYFEGFLRALKITHQGRFD